VSWFKRRRPRCEEAERFRRRAEDDLIRVREQREQVDSTLRKAHAAVKKLDAFVSEVDEAFKLRRRPT
jgi:hypothetical protein